uniref:Putative WD40 repeat-like protein n=1 Tax=Moniliophthora roreri TaxID=221103 RepID=A0A0W0FW22_MONRR
MLELGVMMVFTLMDNGPAIYISWPSGRYVMWSALGNPVVTWPTFDPGDVNIDGNRNPSFAKVKSASEYGASEDTAVRTRTFNKHMIGIRPPAADPACPD